MSNNIICLEGFHGTSLEAAQAILSEGYRLSLGDAEWLGDGIYFFVEGISRKPTELAEKWAIASAWDNDRKCNKYNQYAVLKSDIAVEEEHFLDLTSAEGVEVLDYLIGKYKAKIKSLGKKMHFLDGYVINLARGENIMPIEVVRGNFYIKFATERVNRIERRTANCTICAVYKAERNIVATTTHSNGSLI